ncbi:class F sortase [Arthrobacter crusticola]|uniref:Class F sortase n=1 Tax=Arthrobacter crusticola TaxID=2547960 RepID=A0A4R5TZR7_9MICC|nr:class F sortase [Arthrobacter crusticola]TDK26743.1 class F sortase [Arthrobacter crusticola]
MSRTCGRRWGFAAPAAAVLLFLGGCAGAPAASGPGTSSPSTSTSSPNPSAAPGSPAPTADSPAPAETTAPTKAPAPAARAPSPKAPAPQAPAVLAPSPPVSLSIPSIGATSELLRLGLRADKTLEVPPDGPGAPASWYTESPTPGERGPAVLLGHVNATDGGKGVFADLRAMKPGDRISVAREDGSTVEFQVLRGEAYAKAAFPTAKVYGNTPGAELRLITCDGYDPATGEFDDNYVVYAALVV